MMALGGSGTSSLAVSKLVLVLVHVTIHSSSTIKNLQGLHPERVVGRLCQFLFCRQCLHSPPLTLWPLGNKGTHQNSARVPRQILESFHCSLTEVYRGGKKVKEIETVHNKKVILEEQMEVAISLTPWQFKWLASSKKCKELAACTL